MPSPPTDQTVMQADRRVQVQELSDAIHDAEHELTGRCTAFLKSMGWEQTCNTPGSYWLWRRDFADVDARWREIEAAKEARDGKPFPSLHKPIGVIVTSEESAVNMSRAVLDLLYGEHPEHDYD